MNKIISKKPKKAPQRNRVNKNYESLHSFNSFYYQERDSMKLTSNLLLNRLHGANCYMVPYESLDGGLNARLEKLSKELR